MANGERTTASLVALGGPANPIAISLGPLGQISIPTNVLAAAGVALGGGSLSAAQAAQIQQVQIATNPVYQAAQSNLAFDKSLMYVGIAVVAIVAFLFLEKSK